MEHMQEAYEALITDLKAELKKAYSEADHEMNRNTYREKILINFIVIHCGKELAMEAGRLVDQHEAASGHPNYGLEELIDCDY